MRPRCRAFDPLTWGANAIYDIEDGKLEFRGYYKMPAPQGDNENCVAHNGSIIPVPGRDLFVQAWYQGGISIMDFTDSSNPQEIAYFDRGPIDEEVMIGGGFWSVYWYNGKIYGTEMIRGLDVLGLLPSEHLTANEVAAANLADQNGVFNPQQQFPVAWPADPVIALAYVDQLEASAAMPANAAAEIQAALESASAELASGARNRKLAKELKGLAKGLNAADVDAITARRQSQLADALEGIAERLM